MKPSISNLHAAIRKLHGCESTWIETVPVVELHGQQIVCSGEVEVFDLSDNLTASRCYARTYRTDSGLDRHIAVLHVPPIDSHLSAVRAFIINDFTKSNPPP